MNNLTITAFTDKDILKSLMNFFTQISHNGIASMIPYASYLIWIFGIIDICTTWYLYDGQLKLSMIIGKIMKIGGLYVLVVHWADIAGAIGKSFAYVGYIAGGHTAAEASKMVTNNNPEKSYFNPSYVLQVCDEVTKNIVDGYARSTGLEFGQVIMYGVCWCLVTLGFYFITLQLILTNIEFAVFSCIAIILLPFGCVRFTAFLSNRAISGVFSFGIKMMVMYFLLGIVASLGDSFNTAIALSGAQAKDADGNESTALLYSFMLKQSLAYVTVGYLVWKLPTLVSSMMNPGTTSLGNSITPGTVAATAGAVVGTAAAAVTNSVKAVKAGSEAGAGDDSTGAGSTSGGSSTGGGSSPDAVGEANKATTISESNTGDTSSGANPISVMYNQAKGKMQQVGNSVSNTINKTPLLNRDATMNKIGQYQKEFATKDLAGKAGLTAKMLGVAGAQATIDTAKFATRIGAGVAGGTAKAIGRQLTQLNPARSLTNAYHVGTNPAFSGGSSGRSTLETRRVIINDENWSRMEPPPPPPDNMN